MNTMTQRFLKQTATWEARTGTDAHSGNTYGASATIKVRWFTEHVVLRLANRREVTSSAHISTTATVNEGDRITDEFGRAREIVDVRINRDSRGALSHRVAYLA